MFPKNEILSPEACGSVVSRQPSRRGEVGGPLDCTFGLVGQPPVGTEGAVVTLVSTILCNSAYFQVKGSLTH